MKSAKAVTRTAKFAAVLLLIGGAAASATAAELMKPDGYPERAVGIIVPYGDPTYYKVRDSTAIPAKAAG